MPHYKIVVSMRNQENWECPLGNHPTLESAALRAIKLAELIEWGEAYYVDEQEAKEKGGLAGWYTTNKYGDNGHALTSLEAAQSLFSKGPDFTNVIEVSIIEGTAISPN